MDHLEGGRAWRWPGWAVVGAALVAAALGTGCVADASVDRIGPLAEAWIQPGQVGDFSVVAGVTRGRGILGFTTYDGVEGVVPVRLAGGTVGLGIEATLGGTFHPYPLDLPEHDVWSTDLFGWYTGNAESLVAVGGVLVRHLHHGDVRMALPTVAGGAAAMVGFEWLKIEATTDLEDSLEVGTGDTGVAP